jgi:hypothetical protein
MKGGISARFRAYLCLTFRVKWLNDLWLSRRGKLGDVGLRPVSAPCAELPLSSPEREARFGRRLGRRERFRWRLR